MKIAYTVFHSKDNSKSLSQRVNNFKQIQEKFKKLDYIDNEVVMLKNLKDYKEVLKSNRQLRKINVVGKIRLGAVGLIFTTFLAYEKMLQTNYDIFLIFEDDAQIKSNTFDLVIDYIDELPKDFDIVSLYDNQAFFDKYQEHHNVGLTNLCKSYNDRSTLVYAISKNGMKKYMTLMKEKIDNPIDLYLFDVKKETNQYAIKPTSKQPFFSDFFIENGDPDYEHSLINKTAEFKW